MSIFHRSCLTQFVIITLPSALIVLLLSVVAEFKKISGCGVPKIDIINFTTNTSSLTNYTINYNIITGDPTVSIDTSALVLIVLAILLALTQILTLYYFQSYVRTSIRL